MQFLWLYISAFALTVTMVLALRKPAVAIGLVDHPGGRKKHDEPVPLVGGLAMFASFLVAAWLLWPFPVEPYGSLIVGMIMLVAVGIVDDLRDIRRSIRLLLQLLAASVMVLWGGVAIHSLGGIFGNGIVNLGVFAIPFTMLAMVGLVNAVNMSDGFDGLAGGIVIVALAWLGVVAGISGINGHSVELLIILACTVGGFLVFNMRSPWRRRASVFMGDTGSMMLGFALGWFAVYISQAEAANVPPMTIAFILALPIYDTVTVIFRRLARGVSPAQAARDHIHHILIDSGIPGEKVTYMLVGAAAVYGLVGVVGWLVGLPEWFMFLLFISLGLLHLWTSASGGKLVHSS